MTHFTKKIKIIVLFVFFIGTINAQTQITFYTSMGDFVLETYDTITPITSGNFIKLVNEKFYDGIIFHRVIDNFMIQGGCPYGTGTGTPGYTIADEFISGLSHLQKTISMAKTSAPNSAGSQFFINLVDNTYLDGSYAIFGEVISNFAVVDSIGNVATNSSDKPLTNVVMDSLRVTFDPYASIRQTDSQLQEISIYPNPVCEKSVISISTKAASDVSIILFDQIGKKLYTEQQHLTQGENIINASSLIQHLPSNGIYFLVIENGGEVSRKKLILLK